MNPGNRPQNDRILLDRLRASRGPLSGEVLSRDLGISRVALWKRMETLRAWGYRISSSRRGYELTRDDGLAPADLFDDPVPDGGSEAGTGAAPKDGSLPVRVLARTGSTMDEAAAWGFRGAPSGAAVLALSQSTGRGRGDRAWESPTGGLYLSLILRSVLPAACAGALILEAARSLLGTLEASVIRGVSFRWPNDLVAGSRKLGGILVESYGGLDRPEFYVLGVGVNAARVPLGDRPTAGLEDLSRPAPRRRDLARALAAALRAWCERPDTDPRRWAVLEQDTRRPARAELWDGRVLGIRPRGYTARGELAHEGPGHSLAFGECRKMSYEGEEP